MDDLSHLLTGWYQVEDSALLPCGSVKSLRLFGRDLVIWRTQSGEPRLADAYCPHLGAHLGYGGAVAEEEIVCPFHRWRFDSDGLCSAVPYAKMPHRTAKLNLYPLVEQGGRLFAWFSPSGRPPMWTLDLGIEEKLGSPEMSPAQSYEWTIHSTVRDMGENVADFAHFSELHSFSAIDWEIADEGYVRTVSGVVKQNESPTSGENNNNQLKIRVDYHGPGIGISAYEADIEVIQLSTVTPIDEETVRLHFDFFTVDKALDRKGYLMGRFFAREMQRLIDDDVQIWEHKRYLDRPALVPEDRNLARYRRWLRMFSES